MNTQKEKKPKMTVAEAGRMGGRARARDVDGLRSAQAKGRASFERRFASDEERTAYYQELSLKGIKARKAKQKQALTG